MNHRIISQNKFSQMHENLLLNKLYLFNHEFASYVSDISKFGTV